MKEESDLMQLQINTPHIKGHHLTAHERDLIQQGHDAGLSNRELARQLGVAPQTIHNEIKRGTVNQKRKSNGKDKYYQRYSHDHAQIEYDHARLKCHRPSKLDQSVVFIEYLYTQFFEHKWSIDAVVGYSKVHQLFKPDEMVCTTTLYEYIDQGLLTIKNIDLLEKLGRRTRKHRITSYNRMLGRGIDERPESVEDREEFGHFELDTVQGKRDGQESVILTLVERKTRMLITSLIDGKDAESVCYALRKIMKQYGPAIKTVTADNGSEFADLNQLAIDAYYAHPYSASERGTNERHNRMLRTTFPKGQSLDAATRKQLRQAQDDINYLPRKVLGYATPAELFAKEMVAVCG
jgi:IS30 family transposase